MTRSCKRLLGFRVLGPATSRRRLIDFNTAFAAYAACDGRAEVGQEAYLSAFTYGEHFRKYLAEAGTTKGYDGPCGAPWIWFDLDGEDLDTTLTDGRRLVMSTLEHCRTLDDDDLLLFFSGSKGVHVGLPVTWGPAPSITFHRVARHFAGALAGAARVRIDRAVYDKVRLFRAPNSRHPATGLYKRRLSLNELLHLDAAGIRRLAAAPEPFALPIATKADPYAEAAWRAAEAAVEQEAETRAERTDASGTPRLNRATLDFIRDGAEPGNRHREIFSAAANLAEFGCPPALAHALLTEAALDSGLPPADVRRQIDCGLRHAKPLLAPESAPATPVHPPALADRANRQREAAALWVAAECGPYAAQGGRR